MTTYADPAVRRSSAPHRASRRPGPCTSVGIAVVAGAGLGIGSLVWILQAPSQWASLANSSAGWAIAAFVLGALLRQRSARSAMLGVLMLAVAVETYYAADAVATWQHWSIVWSVLAMKWLVAAVVAGVVFAPAGACAASRSTAYVALGTAIGASVMFGEAIRTHGEPLTAFFGPAGYIRPHETGLLLLGCLVLATALRRPLAFAGAVVLTVPFSLLCAGALAAVGINY